jgi:hypothetical protein
MHFEAGKSAECSASDHAFTVRTTIIASMDVQIIRCGSAVPVSMKSMPLLLNHSAVGTRHFSTKCQVVGSWVCCTEAWALVLWQEGAALTGRALITHTVLLIGYTWCSEFCIQGLHINNSTCVWVHAWSTLTATGVRMNLPVVVTSVDNSLKAVENIYVSVTCDVLWNQVPHQCLMLRAAVC